MVPLQPSQQVSEVLQQQQQSMNTAQQQAAGNTSFTMVLFSNCSAASKLTPAAVIENIAMFRFSFGLNTLDAEVGCSGICSDGP